MKILVYETPIERKFDFISRIQVADAAIHENVQAFNQLKRLLMNRFEVCT